MKNFLKKTKSGFTLIETMISVAVFVIVITIGIGALLNASAVHKRSQKVRSVLDSISFVMEDMSRNLRTGYNYKCGQNAVPAIVSSCPLIAGGSIGGNVLKFTNAEGDDWTYVIAQGNTFGFNDIRKITQEFPGDGIVLNPAEVLFDTDSGFIVTGAEPGNPQPYIIIKLSGKIIYKGSSVPFSLETSVSQRLIDVTATAPVVPTP